MLEFEAIYPGALAILPDLNTKRVSKKTDKYFVVGGKKYNLKSGIAISDRRKNPDRVVGLEVGYKRHRIRVYRAEALGGWDHIYYYVMRVRDKYIPVDSFTSGEENLSDEIEALKKIVDENTVGRKHWKDYD